MPGDDQLWTYGEVTGVGTGASQTELRAGDGDATYRSTYRWSGEAVELVEAVTSAGGHDQRCTFAPGLIIRNVPTEVGQRIASSGDCDGTTFGRVAEVQKQERLTVGGARVDTLVVVVRWSFESGGEAFTVDETLWWSPQHALTVKSTEEQQGAGRVELRELREREPQG